MPKLTLSMDEETIALAKRLAAEKDTSVSALVARIVRSLEQSPGKMGRIGSVARRASGLIDLQADDNDQEILAESLAEKYGTDR